MALTLSEQISAEILRRRQLLLTCPKEHSLDALASAVALGVLLRQQGKLVDFVVDGLTELPYDFLPPFEVKPELTGLQQFTIQVKLGRARLEQFSYDVAGDVLNIYCATRAGTLKPEDVRAQPGEFRYDLIITVGAPDLPSLGTTFLGNREFFERTTIVNIDHHAGNEHFGHINLVDLTAAATAEVVYDLLPALSPTPTLADGPAVEPAVATALLGGFISATESFRSPRVTAKTLRIAAALIAAGAKREAIVRALYQSHSLSALKLWGKTLTRLRGELGDRLVWAGILETDFLEASATADDLPGVTDALLSMLPNAEVVVLLAQEGPDVTVRLTSLRNLDAQKLARPFPSSGDRRVATWQLKPRALPDAEREVVAAVRQNLQELLG